MPYAYGGIFILSLILLPLYFMFVRKKQDEKWLFILFLCVSVVNLGYLLISVSKTVEFALFANKIVYLGQVFVPLCMLMLITKLCGFKFKKWIPVSLISLATLIFALICTTGYLDWYYKSASLGFEAGGAYLIKEYGPLHFTHLIYVLAYFVALFVIIGISLKKNKGAGQKLAGLMLVIVLGNIVMWIIEKIIIWHFELLAVSYLMSEFAFFFVYFLLQDYIHVNDVPKITAIDSHQLGVDIATMPMDIKIGKVLLNVKEGEPLSSREREILEMMLQNKRRKEIALDLHLSENTVKTYTRTLYSKIGVTCREELYALLLQ